MLKKKKKKDPQRPAFPWYACVLNRSEKYVAKQTFSIWSLFFIVSYKSSGKCIQAEISIFKPVENITK